MSLSQVIHPYPTQAEAIKKVADSYSSTRSHPRSQETVFQVAQLDPLNRP